VWEDSEVTTHNTAPLYTKNKRIKHYFETLSLQ